MSTSLTAEEIALMEKLVMSVTGSYGIKAFDVYDAINLQREIIEKKYDFSLLKAALDNVFSCFEERQRCWDQKTRTQEEARCVEKQFDEAEKRWEEAKSALKSGRYGDGFKRKALPEEVTV